MKKNILLISTLVLFLFSACTTHIDHIPVVPPKATPVFAYVVPTLNAQTIDQFTVDPDTGLLASNPAIAYSGSSSQNFQKVTFATVSGVKYAYVTDPNGAVYWCTINTDGFFSNCAPTASMPALGSWQARDVVFATFNAQYAYVVDPGNNVVLQCALDTTGNFSNCQQPPSPYSLPTLAPYGIAFATNTSGAQQSYIADAGSGSGFGDVLLCSMQNDGSFSTCAQTPAAGTPNWIPYAVAFTVVAGTKYAYVADNGIGAPGHVYRCALNNDGSFVNSGCTQTPADDSSLTNWYPYNISFQNLNGSQYAYIANSSGSNIGNTYRCSLDGNGSFTDCVLTPDTPPSSWQPSGIAF